MKIQSELLNYSGWATYVEPSFGSPIWCEEYAFMAAGCQDQLSKISYQRICATWSQSRSLLCNRVRFPEAVMDWPVQPLSEYCAACARRSRHAESLVHSRGN